MPTCNSAVYLGIHRSIPAGLDYLRLRIAPPPPMIGA
jgi:hypothetical protein